jgi:hypothetical protein
LGRSGWVTTARGGPKELEQRASSEGQARGAVPMKTVRTRGVTGSWPWMRPALIEWGQDRSWAFHGAGGVDWGPRLRPRGGQRAVYGWTGLLVPSLTAAGGGGWGHGMPDCGAWGSGSGADKELFEDGEDIAQDADRGLGGIDLMEQVSGVAVEELTGLGFENLEALADGVEVGVVEAIFFEGTALHALDEGLGVAAGEVEDGDDVDGIGEHAGLSGVSGDAVEDESIGFRSEVADLGFGMDIFAPEPDGELIGHELSAAGELEEDAAEFGFWAQAAEDITTGAVVTAGDGAEDFSLSAFSGPWGAEQEDGSVGHGRGHALASLCLRIAVVISAKGMLVSLLELTGMTWSSLVEMRLIRLQTYSWRVVRITRTRSFSASPSTTRKKPGNLVSKKRRLNVCSPRW